MSEMRADKHSVKILTLIGDSAAITDLIAGIRGVDGLSISEPETVDDPVEALHAPIGGVGFVETCQTVTLVLSTGVALNLFVQKTLDTAERLKKFFQVRDGKTGTPKGTIGEKTTSQEVRDMVGSDQRSQ